MQNFCKKICGLWWQLNFEYSKKKFTQWEYELKSLSWKMVFNAVSIIKDNYCKGSMNTPISEMSFEFKVICCVCWAHFICNHELWPTSASHPFSFLSSSFGLAGGKYYQKTTISIFFKILLSRVAFFTHVFHFIPLFLLIFFWLGYGSV